MGKQVVKYFNSGLEATLYALRLVSQDMGADPLLFCKLFILL